MKTFSILSSPNFAGVYSKEPKGPYATLNFSEKFYYLTDEHRDRFVKAKQELRDVLTSGDDSKILSASKNIAYLRTDLLKDVEHVY